MRQFTLIRLFQFDKKAEHSIYVEQMLSVFTLRIIIIRYLSYHIDVILRGNFALTALHMGLASSGTSARSNSMSEISVPHTY